MSGLVGLQDLRGAVRCRRWASQVDSEPRTGTANDILQAAGFSRRFQNAFLRPFFGGVFLDENLDVSADRFLRTLNGFATGHAELPTGGMQQLAEGMADPIRDHIQCNRTVTDIQPGHGVTCADGEAIEAEHIVLATEVDQTMRLLGAPPEPEASIWSSTIACHFSSPSMIMRQPLIALNGSGTGLINLICSPTAVAPGYRSDDMHSIIVSLKPFVGPAPTVDAETVATEAATMLGVDTSSWTWIRNSVITKGLPASNRAHPPSNPPSGIWLTGDWTGDPSIETAVSSGISTAERVLSS